MNKNILILTTVYFVGILCLLISGIQELNMIMWAAILIGIVGLAYEVYKVTSKT